MAPCGAWRRLPEAPEGLVGVEERGWEGAGLAPRSQCPHSSLEAQGGVPGVPPEGSPVFAPGGGTQCFSDRSRLCRPNPPPG